MFLLILNRITLSSHGPEPNEDSLEDRRMKQKLIWLNIKRAASYLLIFLTKGILTTNRNLWSWCTFWKRIKHTFLFCYLENQSHLSNDSSRTFIFVPPCIMKTKSSWSKILITWKNHNGSLFLSVAGKLYFIKWILIITEMRHCFPGNTLIKSWYKCFKAAGKWHLA